VATRSKAHVCSRLIAGIVCSNLVEGMDFRLLFVVCCVGSGLCDGLITCSEKSYRVCVCVRARVSVCARVRARARARVCVCVSDLETSTMRRPRPELGCCATERKKWIKLIIKKQSGHSVSVFASKHLTVNRQIKPTVPRDKQGPYDLFVHQGSQN
jgi:hypothetical protein